MLARHFGVMIALGIALLSGCATVTQGTSQPLTINTDPTGASCTIKKDDQTLGVVNPTPGTVQVEKGWGALTVACQKEDHVDEEARHDSEVQGWTFGNIIIGGVIGFVIDAASGAMRKYPSFITIVLTPRSFPSAEERDRYFDARRERVLREADESEARVKANCQPETCASQLKALDAARQSELAQIEVRRGQAKIGERAMADAPPREPGRKVTLDDLPLPAPEPAPPPAK
jgi:uncharacterized protein YceK